MKIASKFTIAVHTMLVIAYFSSTKKVTSDFIAGSVGVNPVIIRRILQDLKAQGLVQVSSGTGGATILPKLKNINLFDIYEAVIGTKKTFFSFHDNSNPACPIGKKIHNILDSHLEDAKLAFFKKLKAVTLAELLAKV